MRTQATPEALTRIVSNRELVQRLGLSAATLWRMRRRGDFPAPIALSPGRIGWRETDLAAWLDQRAGLGK